ncbi:MAG TPA: DMT family transporter [Actinomycetota bacterium]|nr:DMT family transporter [Actinomycetota bacterium]
MSRLSVDVRGIVVASVAAVVFGSFAVLAKLAYRDGAELLPLLATRFAIAGGLLALYHVATRRPLWPGRSSAVRLLLVGGVAYAAEAALFFMATERAPAGVVSLVFFTYPTWTALLAFATRMERYSHRTVAALVLGTAGVAVIFSIRLESLAGPLLALGAAISLAVYLLVAQVVAARVTPSVAATWVALGAAVAFAAGAVVTATPLAADAAGEAALLGAVTAIAFALLYWAISLIGSARVTIASTLEPVSTIALSALLLGEAITARVAVGAVLVVAALPVLATAPPTQEAATPAGP